MGNVVNWRFGDTLEFKHPICSDCRCNTFHVEISENDDVILHCTKCLNVIDFNLKFSGEYKILEAQLEECRCIKISYFDDSLKCRQEVKRLEAKLAALEQAARRLVDHAKNSKQELWASLPDVINLRYVMEGKGE